MYEKRVHRGAGAEGEDSDSSFTEEEGGAHELVDVDEVEDEEARLIRVGGTGVPVGPVSAAWVRICDWGRWLILV